MIVQAKSGMGKTAVFVIGTLQQIEIDAENKNVDTLVLCHSRSTQGPQPPPLHQAKAPQEQAASTGDRGQPLTP